MGEKEFEMDSSRERKSKTEDPWRERERDQVVVEMPGREED